MQFDYFDIHSHLDMSDFDSDREDVIAKMNEQKIGAITIGVDYDSSEKSVVLAELHKNIFASVGQHPEDLKFNSEFDTRLNFLAENKRVVAIGECGLDYFRSVIDKDIKKVQAKVFEEHIKLSLLVNKPLMLHVRPSRGSQDAYIDILFILEEYYKNYGDKLKGNVHFFSGDADILRRFLNIGFTISFTGVLTFARDYDNFVRSIPADMIMSETDAPFVAPVPFRGGRNSPLFISEIVKKIAEIKSVPFDEVRRVLVENALKHFSTIL